MAARDRWNWDIEFKLQGAWLYIGEERITTACLSDEEVDNEIAMFKKELDAQAKRMKDVIREGRKKPLF